jgi:hypothetical protein
MTEEALHGPVAEVADRRKIVLDMPSWYPRRRCRAECCWPAGGDVAGRSGRLRGAVCGGWISEEDFRDCGYVSIFVANLDRDGHPGAGADGGGAGLIVGVAELWVPAVIVVGRPR